MNRKITYFFYYYFKDNSIKILESFDEIIIIKLFEN